MPPAPAAPGPSRLVRLGEGLWAAHRRFRFFGVVELGNVGLLVRVAKADGSRALAVVNGVELDEALAREVRQLADAEAAPVEFVVGTDWHHLYVGQWCKAFPACTAYFPGPRAMRLHQGEPDARCVMLGRNATALPGVPESELTLVPWNGFRGVAYDASNPEEEHRAEWSVMIPRLETLYIFDVFVPDVFANNVAWVKGLVGLGARAQDQDVPRVRPNFGGPRVMGKGFRAMDPAAAQASKDVLLALRPTRLILSHGDSVVSVVVDGADKCAALLKAVVGDTSIA